jgi:PHD/YefM family antitoxin component YafN of YafNO toxin-antitoxin module
LSVGFELPNQYQLIFADELKETGQPLLLTVDGKVEAGVLGAEIYEKLIDALDYAAAGEGIRRGLEDVREGRTRPAEEFFEEARKILHLRRSARKTLTPDEEAAGEAQD